MDKVLKEKLIKELDLLSRFTVSCKKAIENEHNWKEMSNWIHTLNPLFANIITHLNDVIFDELHYNAQEKEKQETANNFYVAVWNYDEEVPEMPNIKKKFDNLEAAKIEWGKDFVVIYSQNKQGDFVKVASGQYDPDLDSMVWFDV